MGEDGRQATGIAQAGDALAAMTQSERLLAVLDGEEEDAGTLGRIFGEELRPRRLHTVRPGVGDGLAEVLVSIPFSMTIQLKTSPAARTPSAGFQSYVPAIALASPVNLPASVAASLFVFIEISR